MKTDENANDHNHNWKADPSQVLIEREDGCHVFNTPPLGHLTESVGVVMQDEVLQALFQTMPEELPDSYKVANIIQFIMDELTTTEIVVLQRILDGCIEMANRSMMRDIVSELASRLRGDDVGSDN